MYTFSQICRLRDRGLLTTRGGQCNPEGAGLSRARGSYCCGTVDTEDLPHRWGKEARQPKTTAGNVVSEEWKHTHNFTIDPSSVSHQDLCIVWKLELLTSFSPLLCVCDSGCSPFLFKQRFWNGFWIWNLRSWEQRLEAKPATSAALHVCTGCEETAWTNRGGTTNHPLLTSDRHHVRVLPQWIAQVYITL